MNKNEKAALKKIDENIQKLNNKDFTIFFFVVDSKNMPNGTMQYEYQMAKTLADIGYDVKMIYQNDNEYSKAELNELTQKDSVIDENRVFRGVGEWLGSEYMDIEHLNIAQNEWKIGPSDFLFIPEVFSTLMRETFKHKVPCKRIVILHNYDHITEFIPYNDDWATYGMRDVLTTSKVQERLIKTTFPYVDTKILTPYIPDYFMESAKPKQLVVNVVSKKPEDVTKIIKLFYWKYPLYRFVTFRDLRGYSKSEFAEKLKEGAVTIWVDRETPFGYSALEAMKCGSIVIGKVPDVIPEWMIENDELIKSGVWTYDINAIPQILSSVIGTWMQNKVPTELYDSMRETTKSYGEDKWKESVSTIIDSYVQHRIEELTSIKDNITNKKED